MTDTNKKAVQLHREKQGKIALSSKVGVSTREELSLAYTPGVAAVCQAIADDPEKVHELTSRDNWVAVVSDGSAVLGLGNIGPAASAPVMEGKCVLFKEFAGLDAFPIMLDTQNTEEIIETVKRIAPSFGAINLEDIAAPRCFEIEERLKAELDIPVMHDDQHGTAIVVLAGLINAYRVTNRTFDGSWVVISGAGAAGTAIARLLKKHAPGVSILLLDSKGVIWSGRDDLTPYKRALIDEGIIFAEEEADLAKAIVDADVFIGVSKPDILTKEMVQTMKKDSIVFALSNPNPEIMPDVALSAGAAVVATGRSDFPNQVNNVLAYPGVFKGALATKSGAITEVMKQAAAQALADAVLEVSAEQIIPDVFMPGLADVVARAVSDAT